MRKAWNFGHEQTGGPPLKDDWTPWPWPGAGTMKYDKLSRLTLSRMFAARNHIQKLLLVQALFLIAVSSVLREAHACQADGLVATYSGSYPP